MAATKIADVIVPEVFNPYVVERTAELSQLFMGDIISTDPQLDALASRGGKLIQMPFWKDLTGDDEVLSDSSALTVNNIGSDKDQAALIARGKAWGVNDLAEALAGDDPMAMAANVVADYWFRRQQAVLISSLTGVFADNVANDSGDMVIDIAIEDGDNAAAANKISQDAIIDAGGTMGDAQTKLTGVAMHSTIYNQLRKAKVIEYQQRTGDSTKIPMIDDLRVIVDDGCPVVAGGTSGFKHTCYLFGMGAIGLGNGSAPVPTETDRDSLAGEDILINRRHYLLHPRGVQFTNSSVAGATPSNTEFAAAGNWDRVYERKNVRLASLVVNA